MTGNRKEEEEREHTVLLHVIRKSPTPIENILKALQYRKRPKSILGFKPGLPKKNAVALPLVPSLQLFVYDTFPFQAEPPDSTCNSTISPARSGS